MESLGSEKVENRYHLRRVLESRLIAPEAEDKEFAYGEEEKERSVKPKTYLIESNGNLSDIVKDGYELVPSNDKSLWNLVCHDGKRSFYMYMDILDTRFWTIHSTYYADSSDAVVNDLVNKSGARLDHVWLSSDSLLDISRDKTTSGFGINYSNLFVPDAEKSGLSARVWGREIPSVIDGLRKISQIENQISVSSITLRHQVDTGYVNEDVFRDGKLTARSGDSIDSHFSLIENLKQYYSNLIRSIELTYRIKYVQAENYSTLNGTYSVISFSRLVPELRLFADVLTSGVEPFRIWGIWRTIGQNHIRIRGIDMHTNTPVELELMSDELRVILTEGACGNVVTRLFTNIQACFDSNCTLRGLEDAYIIAPHQTG